MISRIAIVANTGLGDALWMMVLAHQFAEKGHSVVLYSDFLCHLCALFPRVSILPYPKKEERASLWKEYDQIFFQHHSPGSKERPLPDCSRVLYKETLNLDRSYVWNMEQIALKELGSLAPGFGLVIPKEWRRHLYPDRVVIHPLSADPTKNWGVSQFLKLATLLQKRGYDPQFIIPPEKRELWQKRLEQKNLPPPITLPWLDLARFLYESGYFIGNDASPGHLASLLQLPTLTLFSRKSRSILYCPSFGRGEVVLPYPFLPGRTLRNTLWQFFLPVSRANNAFCNLTKDKSKNRIQGQEGRWV